MCYWIYGIQMPFQLVSDEIMDETNISVFIKGETSINPVHMLTLRKLHINFRNSCCTGVNRQNPASCLQRFLTYVDHVDDQPAGRINDRQIDWWSLIHVDCEMSSVDPHPQGSTQKLSSHFDHAFATLNSVTVWHTLARPQQQNKHLNHYTIALLFCWVR